MNTELESLVQARRRLERVHEMLLSPTSAALDNGAPDLNFAVERLQQVESRLSAPGGLASGMSRPLYLEIAKLSHELQQVITLLRGAGKFYEGWARLIADQDQPANYDAGGNTRPATPTHSGRMELHG